MRSILLGETTLLLIGIANQPERLEYEKVIIDSNMSLAPHFNKNSI